jgi:hypothetical protein
MKPLFVVLIHVPPQGPHWSIWMSWPVWKLVSLLKPSSPLWPENVAPAPQMLEDCMHPGMYWARVTDDTATITMLMNNSFLHIL